MEVCLASTTKIVELNGVPARIWEGHTAGGIPCHAYITRIAVDSAEDTGQFQEELSEQRPPSQDIAAIPSRLLL